MSCTLYRQCVDVVGDEILKCPLNDVHSVEVPQGKPKRSIIGVDKGVAVAQVLPTYSIQAPLGIAGKLASPFIADPTFACERANDKL